MVRPTCGHDKRFLQPVDGGGRRSQNDTANFVIGMDYCILLLRCVVPSNANCNIEGLCQFLLRQDGCPSRSLTECRDLDFGKHFFGVGIESAASVKPGVAFSEIFNEKHNGSVSGLFLGVNPEMNKKNQQRSNDRSAIYTEIQLIQRQ